MLISMAPKGDRRSSLKSHLFYFAGFAIVYLDSDQCSLCTCDKRIIKWIPRLMLIIRNESKHFKMPAREKQTKRIRL